MKSLTSTDSLRPTSEADMHPAVHRLMVASGLPFEQFMSQMDALERSLQALPPDLVGHLLAFYLHSVFRSYDMDSDAVVACFATVLGNYGSVQIIAQGDDDDDECQCAGCQARRAAEAEAKASVRH